MNPTRSIVITTIAEPNDVLRQYAEQCRLHNDDLIIAGDRKSPGNFSIEGADFWSMERQCGSEFKSAQRIRDNHYARKNIAYLAAIQKGHELIIETDDDNIPYPEFWEDPEPLPEAPPVSGKGWSNVYRLFSEEIVWPRGFPLERIHDAVPATGEPVRRKCPIQQGLSDDNPDVDAVYRLTRKLPLKFMPGLSFMTGKGTWCPFNTQNTVWYREAFPLLYLPSLSSFRMCDIWRSFVAQRVAWEYGWNILFCSPTVYQERNEHDLLQDFRDETSGYLHNARIAKELEKLELSSDPVAIFGNVRECYLALVRMGLLPEEELSILEAWVEDLRKLL